MSEPQIIRRIGTRLREETRSVVEVPLPERLRELVERIAALEAAGKRDSPPAPLDGNQTPSPAFKLGA